MARVALDTNVLAYAEAINEDVRNAKALDLIARLPASSIVIPYQALGELHALLVRKAKLTAMQASQRVRAWTALAEIEGSTPDILDSALNLAANHHFSIWDATILCASSKAGCNLLLSEDMQNGFTWNGVTIVNPFLDTMHPYLSEILTR
jgi:predicted nucleic acid-binding protein